MVENGRCVSAHTVLYDYFICAQAEGPNESVVKVWYCNHTLPSTARP